MEEIIAIVKVANRQKYEKPVLEVIETVCQDVLDSSPGKNPGEWDAIGLE